MKESWTKRLPGYAERFLWILKNLIAGSEEIVSESPNLSFIYLVIILEGSTLLI